MVQPSSRPFGAARVALVLTTACMTLVGLVGPVSANDGGGTIHVQNGQCIQAAIQAAGCGSRIVVEAGTYAERLTIEKDGIALVGHGAILVPPSPADNSEPNTCSDLAGSGTEAGICIQGSDVKLADFNGEHRKVISVGRPVVDVSVTGFQVHGFSGLNIAVVGAKNTQVTRNTLTDGSRYGILTVGSKNTRVAENTVVWTKPTLPFIGICMDDVVGPQVSRNQVSGYNTALCVQTAGADVSHNIVSNSCVGAFVDPGIKGARLRHNHIRASNPMCKTDKGANGVWGIVISAAINTQVRHNLIEGQNDRGPPDRIGAGVAIFDDPPFNPVRFATGNVVTQNTLYKSDVDLLIFTNGTGNVIKQNKCTVSIPPGLCT